MAILTSAEKEFLDRFLFVRKIVFHQVHNVLTLITSRPDRDLYARPGRALGGDDCPPSHSKDTTMVTPSTAQDLNRELAQRILSDSRTDPQSPYIGKFIGLASGQVVVVADNWDELAQQLRQIEPDPQKAYWLKWGPTTPPSKRSGICGNDTPAMVPPPRPASHPDCPGPRASRPANDAGTPCGLGRRHRTCRF